MLADKNMDLVRRFVQLPQQQRELFLKRLDDKGISLAQFPIPAVRAAFEQLPVSYAQQRQWGLWHLNPANPAHHIPVALRLKGELDIAVLRSCFEHLIERHETLRTTFRQEGDQVMQVIHPDIEFELPCEELEAGQDIRARLEAEVAVPFNLEHGSLLRVKLLRLGPDDHVVVVTMHHIIADCWSAPVMVNELIQLYLGHSKQRSIDLPDLPIQYADYAIWQRKWMEAGERERQLAYWKEQLGDEQPVLELPTDRPRPAVQSLVGANLSMELDSGLSQSLKRLAQEQGVTLFMLLLASFQTLLHRYSGQNDIRVGVPIANRNRVETQGLIGFFVNTQVLRAEFDLQMTFGELLQQVKQAALGAQAHQELPFEQLVEVLQPERSLSHSPLFQVMFNHQSQARGGLQQVPGLQVEGVVWSNTTMQFDLMLETYEHERGLSVVLSYAVELFDEVTIEQLASRWRTLLQRLVETVELRVAELFP